MRNRNEITDREFIRRLEQKYFDGETTVEEERLLRSLTAAGAVSEETGAVVSWLAVDGGRKQPRRRGVWLKVACCAAVLAGTVGVTLWQTSDRGECVAYVGTQRIDDAAVVMSMMEQDLALISDASRSFDEQIADDIRIIKSID